ncbi:MAG: hypothetical protein JJ992_29095, partial [Planctomycetes bacterium]|nr:hypothetical protein [Planctomycetota bacterium]
AGHVLGGRVTGPGTEGLDGVWLDVRNALGETLLSEPTHDGGYYQTRVLPADTYFVTTRNEPPGLGREIYDDVLCNPSFLCDDPWHIRQNGTPIELVGEDRVDINFDLAVPEGGMISGRVSDASTAFVMPGIWLVLVNADPDPPEILWGLPTFADGTYSFAGLEPGRYKILAEGVPEGYSQELFGGDFFPCDLETCGAEIAIEDSATVITGADIALDFAGTRIVGQITRSDTLEPISGAEGYIGVELRDTTGEFLGGWGANEAGVFEIPFETGGEYYLYTVHEAERHNVVDEIYDNIQCIGYCDPVGVLAPRIPVTSGTTQIANFELDPGRTISGTVSSDVDGTLLENVEMCVAWQTNRRWLGCMPTGPDGRYELSGLPWLEDLVLWTQNLNGLPFFREMYDEQPCCQIRDGTAIDVSGGDVTLDIGLARSATIAGRITASDTGAPIENAGVYAMNADCDRLNLVGTDMEGNYLLTELDAGNYYLYAFGSHLDYVDTLYPHFNRYDPCWPDPIDDGTPVSLIAMQDRTGIDFQLDSGGRISGNVSSPEGDLPGFRGLASIYDLEGNVLRTETTGLWNSNFTISGLIPGTYHLLLSSSELGLVDERYDDVTCPRNSCNTVAGLPLVVKAGEHLPNRDAVLAYGSTISGTVTKRLSDEIVPDQPVAVYTSTGKLAALARTNDEGVYTTFTGLPEGDYIVSNQSFTNVYYPVEGGYLPQVWKEDGSFGACGVPCDFLEGDLVAVNGTDPRTGIDLAMEYGKRLAGTVTGDGSALDGVEVRLLTPLNALVGSVETNESGAYAFDGLGSGTYRLRTVNDQGFEDQLYDGWSCNPSCNVLTGTDIDIDVIPETIIDFYLEPAPSISGSVSDLEGPVGGVNLVAVNTLGNTVKSTVSEPDGSYTLSNLYAGTFFVRTLNASPYIDALWGADGGVCPTPCEPEHNGGEIELVSGEARTGIDLQLASGASISGVVTDGVDPISGIEVQLYLDTGDSVGQVTTGGDGAYAFEGVSPGEDYHLVTHNALGYVDEDAYGNVCQSGCLPWSTPTFEVAAPDSPVVITFELDLGGVIGGHVVGGEPEPAALNGV